MKQIDDFFYGILGAVMIALVFVGVYCWQIRDQFIMLGILPALGSWIVSIRIFVYLWKRIRRNTGFSSDDE